MSETGPVADGSGPRKTWLERALTPVADVRAGEGLSVLLMALTMVLLLGSYYMLKTVREALILSEGGAAVKTYSSAGQALLLLFLVPAYGAFASRVNRIALVRWVTLFFVSNVVVFIVLGRAGVHLGIPFFLWVGIFNVMVVAAYWGFANDIYSPEQGKRLFAVVGLGTNLGAWMGSAWASHLVKLVGPYGVMGAAAAVLVACVGAAQVVSGRQARLAPREATVVADQPLAKVGGFELIFKDRYLLMIAALIVVLNVANTLGEYLLGKMVVVESIARLGSDPALLEERQKFIGAFYGEFFSYANLASFLLQTFAVSRIIKFVGVGGALFFHPVIAFLGYLSMVRVPSLGVVSAVKVLDNSTDYSLGNTAKQALWLPTSREAKYKAKQAVDSFFMRAGDVLAAGAVFVGERLAFTVPVFAAVNVGLAVVWLVIVGRLAPENRRRMGEANAPSAA
jgi:ATP:ADP antiporter, AAA family